MTSRLMSALVAAAVLASSAAFAATTTSGTVKAFDLTRHTITLDNGIVYMLPGTFRDPGLKVGAKVDVAWDMKGSTYEATGVTLTN
jgi:hypothetical protein